MSPWWWMASGSKVPQAPRREVIVEFDLMTLLAAVLVPAWYGLIVFGCALIVGGSAFVGVPIVALAAFNLLRMA